MMGKVFVPTKYAGYYWNVETKTLFSTKGKQIRELKKHSYFSPRKGRMVSGYSVYVKAGAGQRKGHSEFIEMVDLYALNSEPTMALATYEVVLLPEELFVI